MKYFLTLIQLWVGFLSICASYPKANIWIIPSVESPQVYRNYAQTSKVHLEMARGEVEHIQLVFPSKVKLILNLERTLFIRHQNGCLTKNCY